MAESDNKAEAAVGDADKSMNEGMFKPKSLWIATALAIGYGGVGLDRFYLGYMIFGIIKAITFGGFGIWALIDTIFISHCWLNDADGDVLQGCEETKAFWKKNGGSVVDKAEADTTEAVADDAANADF
jgi:TM2 domain-containing membrane protein YozV